MLKYIKNILEDIDQYVLHSLIIFLWILYTLLKDFSEPLQRAIKRHRTVNEFERLSRRLGNKLKRDVRRKRQVPKAEDATICLFLGHGGPSLPKPAKIDPPPRGKPPSFLIIRPSRS